jgi:hypothetical protein
MACHDASLRRVKSKPGEPGHAGWQSASDETAETPKQRNTEKMKLKDAIELQTMLAADSNYSNPTIWNHGEGWQVTAVRGDGAKITCKITDGYLIVEVSNQ